MPGKKLAIITHEFYPVLCGGTVFVDKLSQSLIKLGYEIEIFTTGIGRGFPKTEKLAEVTVHRFYTGRRSKADAEFIEHVGFLLLGLPQMFFYFLRHRFDIVWSVFVIPSGLIGLILAKMFRTPSVVFVDAADTPGVQSAMKGATDKLAFLFKWITRNSDGVIICDGLQDIAMPLIKNDVVAAIPNGTIIPERIAKPGQSEGPSVEFLSIGRLVFRKGFREIIQALALVKKQTSNFHLTIVGYGTGGGEVVKPLNENNLGSNITLTGRVEYEELCNYYLNSDCYLFYGDREGSSLAMVEALSYGLPIIATDHPGNTTYVKDNYDGLLVEHNNIAKLTEALLTVINNKSRLAEWGMNSREVAKSYTWDNIAAEYDKVFCEAAAKRR